MNLHTYTTTNGETTTAKIKADQIVFAVGEDGETTNNVDYLKTLKAFIKAGGEKIGSYDFNEDGTEATSVDGETVITLAETIQTGMSKTLAEHAVNYEKTTGYSGAKTRVCGDDVSHLLLPLSPEQVIAVAEEVLNLEVGSLTIKYAHLNRGAQRMNAGNRIRGAVKNGTIDMAIVEAAVAG